MHRLYAYLRNVGRGKQLDRKRSQNKREEKWLVGWERRAEAADFSRLKLLSRAPKRRVGSAKK